MNSETIQCTQSDVSLARAAIHAYQRTESGPCLNDERLSAFMSGDLRGNDRESVVGHLNHCSHCYRQWLEVAADLEEIAQTAQSETRTRNEAPAPLEKFRAWLLDWRPWVPALAMGCLIAVAVLWPNRDGVDRRIDSAYANVVRSNVDSHARNTVRDFPLPWDASSLGFSESEPSAAAAAFRNGLLDGQQRILQSVDTDTVTRSSLAEAEKTYFQLARWMLLLWTQLGSRTEAIDWAWQRDTGTQLVAQMQSLPNGAIAEQAVDIVAPVLNKLTGDQPYDKSARDDLQRHIVIAVQRLAFM